MKYQKKPIIIDTFQFIEGFFVDKKIPQEFKDACCRKNDTDATFERPHIHTLEGIHWITVGDWIVKGIKGEFYPVKPDIFEMTYEKVKVE